MYIILILTLECSLFLLLYIYIFILTIECDLCSGKLGGQFKMDFSQLNVIELLRFCTLFLTMIQFTHVGFFFLLLLKV